MGVRDRVVSLLARVATARVPRRFPMPAEARELSLSSGDGTRISAWVREPMGRSRDAMGEPCATVILGHGYRDDRRQLYLPLAPALASRGVRTIALDFRAHGASEGDFITVGHDEALDVEAALAHARTLSGLVLYIGFSMGAAAYLLSREEADAALLDSPYDTLEAAIHARLDLFRVPRRVLEGRRRLRDHARFPETHAVRPLDRVPHLLCPTLFLFAPRDLWLGPEVRARFTQALAPASTLELLARGGHQHLHEEWRQRALRFVDERLAAPRGNPANRDRG